MSILPRIGLSLIRGVSLRALPIAAVGSLSLLALAPADWFLRVASIEILETHAGKAVVIQVRSVWPGDVLQVQWAAQVDSIEVGADGHAFGVTVCSGSGSSTVRDDDFQIVHMPLSDWVNDPECSPEPGLAHIAHASWRFRILGFTKEATQRSPAFTLSDRTIQVRS